MFRYLLAAALLVSVFSIEAVADDKGARPAEARTDIVFLLDVSGSMRKQRGLARAREVLRGVVDKVVHPGTHVAVIPFGTGVRKGAIFSVPEDPRGAQRQREAIRDAIERIRARDSYTYLYSAIYSGLDTLMEFKKSSPDHARHIILISDGKQLTRRGEEGRTLAQILAHFEKLGFNPPDDWFIWYGHFGEPDDTLKRALEASGAGKTISLDNLPSLNWAYTRVAPKRIELGRRRPGAWTRKVAFVAQTDEAGIGRTVGLDIAGEFPEGMSVTLEPATAKLTGRETRITAEISCVGGVAGDFAGTRLVVSAKKGTLHWVEAGEIELPFIVARPRVDVGSQVLSFGRLAPGTVRTRRLSIIPNEDATAVSPQLRFNTVDVPEGTRVSLDRKLVRVGERVEVAVTVRVMRGTKPGDYSCRLVLDGGNALEVVPGEVRVEYRVGFGRVTVGEDRLGFSPVRAGQTLVREITLTPDDETAAQGTVITVEVVDAPTGVALETPGTVRLQGRTKLPVELRVPADAKVGQYTAKLRFKAEDGIRVEPFEIPVTIEVASSATLSVPALVDLGDVAGSRAREIAGRLALVVPRGQTGSELELVAEGETTVEPRVIPLRPGSSHVPVRLSSVQTKVGEHRARFKAVLVQADGVRKELGTLAFRWRVVESYLRVKSWAGPAALPTGDGATTGQLVVEVSPDLAGRQVRIAAAFSELVAGMGIDVDGRPVTLRGGLQTIPVRLQVTGARAGLYPGTLSIGLTEAVDGVTQAEPVKASLEVAGATVQVVALQGSLEGLARGDERQVDLVLAGAALPVPTILELSFDRGGLPPGVEADMPATVQLKESDGTLSVPLRFVMKGHVGPGRWTARVSVKARTPGVAVAPDSVEMRASVPKAVTVVQKAQDRTAMWIAIGVGAVLLLVVVVVMLRRRNAPEVVHVSVPEPAQEPLKDLIEEDDMFVLEGFESEDQ